jgi:DeoR family transcriptional regulator, aga operon transcriptional repressor
VKNQIEKVKDILTRKGYSSVSDLAKELAVSEVTVRRYLDELEKRAFIKRTHGGAFVGEEMIDVDFRVRETIRREEKEAIGRLGFSLIESGESIFIDTGSTAAYLASAIDDTKRLTVITNSIVVAETLENKSNVKTILLGGQVYSPMHCVLGPLAEDAIKVFHYSKAFIGAAGLSMKNGLTQGNIEEIPIKRFVAENAKEMIVLLDSSKFHKEVLISFLSLRQIDVLITDNGVADADRAALEELGIRVMIATPSAKQA